METLAIYLLKMLICSAVLYGYYRVALFNERFHQWNRFYLLAAMLLSVVVPFVNIPLFTEQPVVVTAVSAMPWNVAIVASTKSHVFSWQQIISAALLAISAVLLIRILISVTNLLIAYKKNPVSRMNEKVQLIVTELNNAPFSFFNWLFWRQDIDPESPSGQRMLAHELTHIRERHSYDKLFTELLLCVFWMNPIFWLMRKELDMIHEFLADRKAIEKQDGKAFAEMILQAIHVQPQYAMTNPFFSSQIKRRLQMITTSKTPQYTYLRRISGLVVMIGSAIVLTLTVQQAEAQKKEKETVKKSVASTSEKTILEKVPVSILTDATGHATLVKDTSGNLLLGKWFEVDRERNQSYNKVVSLENKGKEPLYILDGKELDTDEIGKLQSADIQDINVLKRDEAIILYGDKGKNGAVFISKKVAKSERQQSGIIGRSLPSIADTSKKPLYILEGMESTPEAVGLLKDLIENVQLLKDEKAIKKYGQKGKNGVIEIKLRVDNYSEGAGGFITN